MRLGEENPKNKRDIDATGLYVQDIPDNPDIFYVTDFLEGNTRVAGLTDLPELGDLWLRLKSRTDRRARVARQKNVPKKWRRRIYVVRLIVII